MALVFLSRREHFSACHRLHSFALSDEENRQVFGKCNNPNGHGHNYVLEVTVKGAVDPATGMVINLCDLKEIIGKGVMEELDHKNIDLDVEFFRDSKTVSTTENLAVFIWKQVGDLLRARHASAALHEIKIWETEKNIVVYRGE